MKPKLFENQRVENLNNESSFTLSTVTKIYVKHETDDDDLYFVELKTNGVPEDYSHKEWLRYSLNEQYYEIIPDRIAHEFLAKENYKTIIEGFESEEL